MSELVDQREVRVPGEHGVEIHFGELHPAVLGESTRDHLKRPQHPCRRGAVMGLDNRDDYVLALTE